MLESWRLIPPVSAAAGAATAAAEATPATAAVPPVAAVGLGPGFIHREIAACQIGAVQPLHRLLGGVIIRHFDESKSARLTGIPIGDDTDFIDWAVGFK